MIPKSDSLVGPIGIEDLAIVLDTEAKVLYHAFGQVNPLIDD